jgi:hypothetical protein
LRAADKGADAMDLRESFRSFKLAAPWVLAAGMVLGATALFHHTIPPNTISPFCTYDLTYRLNATIEVGGRHYASQVAFQQPRRRGWIMNLATCRPSYGVAMPFRLPNDRVVLLWTNICDEAQKALADRTGRFYPREFRRAMAEGRTIDVTRHCIGIIDSRDAPYHKADGYVLDNGERPAHWGQFRFGHPLPFTDSVIRLVSATAQAVDIWPTDQLDKLAPGVFKTVFKGKEWSDSPAAMFSENQRRGWFPRYRYVAERL